MIHCNLLISAFDRLKLQRMPVIHIYKLAELKVSEKAQFLLDKMWINIFEKRVHEAANILFGEKREQSLTKYNTVIICEMCL